MEITSITPTGFKVLEALNTYRFLTITQMLQLGIARDRGNLGKVLKGMVSAQKDDQGTPLISHWINRSLLTKHIFGAGSR